MAEHRVKYPLPRMAGYGRNQDPAPFSFYNSRWIYYCDGYPSTGGRIFPHKER